MPEARRAPGRSIGAGRLTRRPAFALLAVALVLGSSACGFRPMYGERPATAPAATATAATPVATDLATIDVAPIADRSGQLLRNRLELMLDPAASTGVPHRYTLAVQLKEKVETFAVERSGFATRANVESKATYTLQEDATGSHILGGTARAISGYNLLDNDFSTLVGADDARSRAIDQIAYQIRNRLALFFTNPKAFPPAKAAEAEPGVPAASPAIDSGPDVIDQGTQQAPIDPFGQ